MKVNKRGVENHLLYAVNLPHFLKWPVLSDRLKKSGTNTGVREQETSGAAESFALRSFLKP